MPHMIASEWLYESEWMLFGQQVVLERSMFVEQLV